MARNKQGGIIMNKRGRPRKTNEVSVPKKSEPKALKTVFYPREEQETTCVYDVLKNKWVIFTTARRHLTRMLDKFGEPLKGEYNGDQLIAGRWELPSKVISFRKLEKKPRKQKTQDSM